MNVHSLKRDVAGRRYRELLKVLLRTQESFSLTWRDQLSFESSAHEIGTTLQAVEVRRKHTAHWPGTRLVGSKAVVVTYQATGEALETLAIPGSLYSWRSPRFPEDLAFYASPRACSFASVAHEREAWVLHRSLAKELSQLIALELEEIPGFSEPIIAGAV